MQNANCNPPSTIVDSRLSRQFPIGFSFDIIISSLSCYDNLKLSIGESSLKYDFSQLFVNLV